MSSASVAVDDDRVVGPELAGQRELVGVGLQAGDDDRPGAGGPRGDHRGEPALARAEHEHGVAEPDPAEVQAQRTPAPSGLNITASSAGRVWSTLCRTAPGVR